MRSLDFVFHVEKNSAQDDRLNLALQHFARRTKKIFRIRYVSSTATRDRRGGTGWERCFRAHADGRGQIAVLSASGSIAAGRNDRN